jgi:hypothetical protein
MYFKALSILTLAVFCQGLQPSADFLQLATADPPSPYNGPVAPIHFFVIAQDPYGNMNTMECKNTENPPPPHKRGEGLYFNFWWPVYPQGINTGTDVDIDCDFVDNSLADQTNGLNPSMTYTDPKTGNYYQMFVINDAPGFLQVMVQDGTPDAGGNPSGGDASGGAQGGRGGSDSGAQAGNNDGGAAFAFEIIAARIEEYLVVITGQALDSN